MLADIFKEAFNGVEQQNNFQQGFDDAIAGKPARSTNADYENGYSVAYEYTEKESSKCQLI